MIPGVGRSLAWTEEFGGCLSFMIWIEIKGL